MKCIFSKEAVEARLDELAAEINALYAGKPLVVVCVLKGGFMFFSDLVKRLTCAPEIDFVRLASYGAHTEPGTLGFTKDVELSLEGKHVLVVEDIVDTGRTMAFLLNRLAMRGALSLRLAVLLDKTGRRDASIHSDFVGFSIPDSFVVGYGLDYAEKYRELPAIYELSIEDRPKPQKLYQTED